MRLQGLDIAVILSSLMIAAMVIFIGPANLKQVVSGFWPVLVLGGSVVATLLLLLMRQLIEAATDRYQEAIRAQQQARESAFENRVACFEHERQQFETAKQQLADRVAAMVAERDRFKAEAADAERRRVNAMGAARRRQKKLNRIETRH